ncbi:MAG: M24 family metallopeptidase [Azospirillaceae bacterium]
MRQAALVEIEPPAPEEPLDLPVLDPGIYRARFARFMDRVDRAGLEIAAVFADREHSANLAWLTGFDPRFEEALLIARPGADPILLTGPENQGPAGDSPVGLDVRLYPPMGLMGQAREATPPLGALLAEAGIQDGMTVGVAGWKYYTAVESPDPEAWLEIPSYLADALRRAVGASGRVVNGGPILMDAGTGLRAVHEIDQLAVMEASACHTSAAVGRVIRAARPGLREVEIARALEPLGLPLCCHPMLSSGPRAWHGLLSPTARTVERGDAITTAYGVQGALNCRAGWLAEGPEDLPAGARDYVDRLVAPYFGAVAEWYETVGLDVTGGDLDAVIRRRLGDPFFGIGLNPGHLIGLDEWMNSPVRPGDTTPLASGMALQVDIIPATGGPYFTTNIEDGIALLDADGRAAFAERHPAAWARIEARRAFMGDVLGIRLKPEVLPFSDLAGWLPPFWLAPGRAMALR